MSSTDGVRRHGQPMFNRIFGRTEATFRAIIERPQTTAFTTIGRHIRTSTRTRELTELGPIRAISTALRRTTIGHTTLAAD